MSNSIRDRDAADRERGTRTANEIVFHTNGQSYVNPSSNRVAPISLKDSKDHLQHGPAYDPVFSFISLASLTKLKSSSITS